jgi:cellobiose-specific phosphotransferase system component IIA
MTNPSDTTLILNALETCLQALQRIPTGQPNEHKREIEAAKQALTAAYNLAKREMVEKILGTLFLLEYDRDHILYRITVEDFADLLADRLVQKGRLVADLTPGELENLVDLAGEYLNGEGMPWVDVINIALTDAWPERLKGSIQ